MILALEALAVPVVLAGLFLLGFFAFFPDVQAALLRRAEGKVVIVRMRKPEAQK